MTLGNFFFSSSGAAAYEIEQSLRFDGSTGKLTRTNPASSGITNAYKWSYSFWLKQSDVTNTGTIEQPLLSGGNTSGAGRTYCGWGYVNSGRFWIGNYTGADYRPDIRPTDRVWRDPSAWEHFMLVYDTSESVNTDRIKIYSNGVRWNPTGGVGSTIGSSQLFYAVNYAGKASNIGYDNILNKYFDGYMAEVHFVDGQALDQYDFGEFDNSGVWRPIAYTGTYGSNGHYLKFDPSATNGIGHDHSGNGNNFTATGFTTSGTGTDVMNDTPTNNFCTINPLAYSYVYYGPNAPKNGNLDVVPRQTYSGNWTHGVGTFPLTSGKWYFEIENDGGTNAYCGLYRVSDNTSWPWNQESSTYQYVYYSGNGNKINTSSSSYGASWNSAGDIVGVAYDGDAGTLTFYKNGTSQGTAFTGLTGTYVPRAQAEDNSGAKLICNFGQRAFAYTPPTGFNALSTSNYPAPDIADGSDYFNSVIYAPDGSSSFAVTGVGFQPDLVWVKSRVYNEDHQLNDAVRGATKGLQSNLTNAETTQTNGLTSFDSDGFTVGNLSDYNYNGDSIISWNWKANGSGSSNTDGSITSTVSVNATAGFSIVSYTGTQAAATVGHGLGVAPSLIIARNRDSVKNWRVQHASLGPTKYLSLNLTDAAGTASSVWNNTAPTSTVFSVADDGGSNGPSNGMVAYCFAEVEGYSKFGSYTGNGSTDGVFVYTGFRPSFILQKRSSGAAGWNIWDTTRNSYNVAGRYIQPNSSDAEFNDTTNYAVDILSNGFKLRSSYFAVNGSGNTFIFAAFASSPFGGSGVSPVTAR